MPSPSPRGQCHVLRMEQPGSAARYRCAPPPSRLQSHLRSVPEPGLKGPGATEAGKDKRLINQSGAGKTELRSLRSTSPSAIRSIYRRTSVYPLAMLGVGGGFSTPG